MMTRFDTAGALPQLRGALFLADGGLETTMIFHEGLDLPLFAAFPLLGTEAGRAALRRYFGRYVALARARGLGVILDTVTWRANADWGARLGWDAAALDRINREAVAFAGAIRAEHGLDRSDSVLNGVLGPRGDGYRAEARMSVDEACAYHLPQMRSLALGGAEMVSAITMTTPEEGAGIARAARAAGLQAVVSFTVETDGRLPDGTGLAEAIRFVDDATGAAPVYYMVNCAHPEHFAGRLDHPVIAARLRGLRANASRLSHAELDAATDLDDGDPAALGRDHARLAALLPGLCVVGGCCGTDHRHVAAMADAIRPRPRPAAA